MEAFPSDLATAHRVSASTQNQAPAALLLLHVPFSERRCPGSAR